MERQENTAEVVPICALFGLFRLRSEFRAQKLLIVLNVYLYLRSGEGNGTPLQYSCLENPMDGGAWWAAVHGVSKSWTGLNDFHFTSLHFTQIVYWER